MMFRHRFDPLNVLFYFMTEIVPLLMAGVAGYAIGSAGGIL